jgi:nitroreductase
MVTEVLNNGVNMGKEITNGEQILEQLNWRYAVKQYDKSKKVSEADWKILEESLELAPSSFGLQPYKFFVVKDQAVREKLRAAAYGQSPITDASHLVVFAFKKTLSNADVEHFIDRVSEVRRQDREALAEYEDVIKGSVNRAVESGTIETWNSRQAYIPLGFLLQTAALLGIDATPMEGFDAQQVNEILGLSDYSAVAIAAVGYRDTDNDWLASLPKVRMPRKEIVQHI